MNNPDYYNPFFSVELIVWAMFIGFIIASLMAVYNKRIIGGFVKSVMSEECFSPETARTIIELGYGTDWFIKNALRTDTVLRRFIVRIDAEGSEPDGEKKAKRSKHDVIDFSTARFYIPEELKYRAEVRYARRGTDFFTFAICIVLLAAAAFAAIYIIPELIQFIKNFGTYVGTL